MSTLTRNTGARNLSGQVGILIKQVKRNASTGDIEEITGNDVFGAAAGTFHDGWTYTKSSVKRDDGGIFTLDGNMIEFDHARRRVLILAAPYSKTGASSKKPNLDAEDGSSIVSGDSTSEDANMPLWQVIKREADDPLTGNYEVYAGVMQFKRAGGWDNTPNAWTNAQVTLFSVDAEGYTPTKPTALAFPWVDDITFAELTGPTAMGDIFASS